MKNKIICRAVFYVLIVVTVGCLVAALCLLSDPTAYTVLFCIVGATFLAQPITATAIFINKKTALNGFVEWGTSLEISLIIVLLIALLPLCMVMLIVDNVIQRRLRRQAQN